MNNLFKFESINIEPPKDKIFRRLGYRKDLTITGEERKKEVEKYIEEVHSLIEIRTAVARLPIKTIENPKIIAKSGEVFESANLCKLLEKSNEILIMGTTAGSAVTDEIQKLSTGKNLTKAVVFDAAASEIVDASFDWILNFFKTQLRRENKTTTNKRFSAGYGDFKLENQKMIYEIINMRNLGVKITQNYILIPEKSVTAVAGVENRGE